jgi:hypothetical protein
MGLEDILQVLSGRRHVRQMTRRFGAVGRRAAVMSALRVANTTLAEKVACSTTVCCCGHNRRFPLRFEVAPAGRRRDGA